MVSLVDRPDTLCGQAGDIVLHVLKLLGRMTLPCLDLTDDAQRRLRAVGLGGVAGELGVGEVGIVDERADRLDDIDALAPRACRQFAPPDRGVERGGEIDPRRRGACAIIGRIAGGEQVAEGEIPAAATAPLRAASAVDAMPVTNSENTSGITVICSALSQAEPIGCATAVAPGTAPGSQVAKAMPRSNPAPSDTRIRVDGLFNVADILALIRKRRYHAPLKIRA